MSTIAPQGTRATPGLKALRKRYVRRAESLCSDPEFIEQTRKFRVRWQVDFPEFPLQLSLLYWQDMPSDQLLLKPIPEALDRALEELEEKRRKGQRPYGSRDEPPPTALQALERWRRARELIELRYWPELDFPTRFLTLGFPGELFIARTMSEDPRTLLGTCDSLFFPLGLTPRAENAVLNVRSPLSSEDDYWLGGGDDLASEMPLTVTLYPGVTEKDIRDAASDLAKVAEWHYGHLATAARVRAYRANGCSHQAIAERLGMTAQNVARVLSSPEQATEFDELL